MEKRDYREEIKSLLVSLYNLSYANPLIFIISQLVGRSVVEAEEAYPEVFGDPQVRPYLHLLISIDETGKMKLSRFGESLMSFVSWVHGFLEEEGIVARINATYNLNLTNPRKDLVYTVIGKLNKEERIITKIVAETYGSVSFSEVKGKAKSSFNIELDEEVIKKTLKKLQDYLLADKSYSDRFVISDIYKKHILSSKIIKELEEKK